MIYKVEKVENKENTYLINDSLQITIDESLEDGYVTADYDDTLITEQEAEEITNEFFRVAFSKGVNKQ